MKSKVRVVVMILIPIILCLCMLIYLESVRDYNTTERKASLSADAFKDGIYENEDVRVKLALRGGDSGAWQKDPIFDENENMVHGPSVGIIYDVFITNCSKNVLADWKMKVPVNELMWINNSWNSELEIHQNVKNDEKVMSIDLSDYSQYDIKLDYYVDPTGPMIPLYEGDYFIYKADADEDEFPINPAKSKDKQDKASVKYGYIMYIPDQTVDYVADFSGGEFIYHMNTNPFQNHIFWVIVGLMLVYIIWLIVIIVVSIQLKSIVKRQQIEKEHDRMMVEQTMKLIINIIERKDSNTKGHSIRVANYARLIAEMVGYSEDAAQQVYYIGLLHDCGKVNIPNAILKNPGKLSDTEYAEMKNHTTYGGEVLKDFTSIDNIAVGAKYHHERYDGTGYPMGLSGEEIPEIARIIGVADAFDAMNSERCYRGRLPKDVIIKELTENKGKQFDPKYVDCMLKLIESGKVEI